MLLIRTCNFSEVYGYDSMVLRSCRTVLFGDKRQHFKYIQAYRSVITAARQMMPPPGSAKWFFSYGPWSVMNKSLSLPNVSDHEYISIGIYNHPCNNLPADCKPYPGGHLLPPDQCDNTTGLPWEPCDGIVNHDAVNDGDSPRSSQMAEAIIRLSHAAFFCNESTKECASFAKRAIAVLRVFFLDDATKMLPNFYYGQIDPRTVHICPVLCDGWIRAETCWCDHTPICVHFCSKLPVLVRS